jgi:organic radical activating enzyme
MRYPLAPDPVFWTLQGEKHLRGFQMAFVRLGGCSVGCPGCDTNYRVTSRATADEIVEMVRGVTPTADRDWWVWITGGEPTDHDLRPLLTALKRAGFATAVATSGVRRVIPPVDWLSVSPHSADPGQFHQRYGNELALCEGLNGLDLDAWHAAWPDDKTDFMYRYVQPLWINGREDPASLERCKAWLKGHPRWALSRQDHKHWGVA